MYGLIDCNNFYASCERVFNPALRNRPVIVLSNNDGCVIARSNEAKALGIKMGVPYYQVKDIVKQHGVFTFSSNYTLYGDMSHRVMSLIRNAVPHIEIYSIDECFVGLSGVSNLPVFCQDLTQKVSKGTGIPLSMGVASTKTLAKVASKFAKKYKAYHGVCIIDTEVKREKALQMTPIEDVWGIGRRLRKQMEYFGVKTAYDFTLKSESWVRKEFSVTGLRTWKELRGLACIDFEAGNKKKSITTSRSFSKSITRFQELYEAVANFTDACARKLREQESKAGSLLVYIVTNSHREDLPQYHNSASIKLPVPSSDPSEMVKYAKQLLQNIYREGYDYKKAGVLVYDIASEGVQTHLFDTIDRSKQARLLKVIDSIKNKAGDDSISLVIQGPRKIRDFVNKEYVSKHFSTNINEIIEIKV